jgi:hypothetical protein
MHPIKQLKIQLKELSGEIRKERSAFRLEQSSISKGAGSYEAQWKLFCKLEHAKYEFRHRHIVRCLLRGRTRDQIEKPKHNQPNEDYIKKLLEENHEAIRRCQEGSESVATSSAGSACSSGVVSKLPELEKRNSNSIERHQSSVAAPAGKKSFWRSLCGF